MKKLSPGTISGAVFLTAVFTLVAFQYFLGEAKIEYARTHQLAVYERTFLFFNWREKQEVTISMLSAGAFWLTVIFPTLLYMVLHPVVGRLVSAIMNGLSAQLARVVIGAPHNKWAPDTLVLVGSAWPATMLLIPLQVIALIIASVYRALWSYDDEA